MHDSIVGVPEHLPVPLVLATANADKVREILEVFTERFGIAFVAQPLEFDAVTYGHVMAPAARAESLLGVALAARPDMDETADTLAGNARIKAEGLRAVTGATCIADDTGLVVDALGGAPGVHSARYAGPSGEYSANVAKLLRELEATPPLGRTARFLTVIHGARADGGEFVVDGAVEGTITSEPRGAGTFGYDPVFVPVDGDGRTFAEMAPTEKHALSHRGRAVRALLDLLTAQES